LDCGWHGKVYTSQYGIQHPLFAPLYLNSPFSNELTLSLLRGLVAATLALVFTLFVNYLAREFSLPVAIVTLLFLIHSTWLVLYGRNLYWISPSLFLPFVFALIFFPKLKRLPLVFYSILTFLFFFKSLAGYEFLSNVILAPLSAIVYHLVKANSHKRQFLFHTALVCLAGALGFLLALTLHLNQLHQHFGNYPQAWEKITERASVRTFGELSPLRSHIIKNFSFNHPYIYPYLNHVFAFESQNSPWPQELDLILIIYHYLISPTINHPFLSPLPQIKLGNLALFILLSFSIIYYWYRQSFFNDKKIKSLSVVTTLSLVFSNSWSILGFGHTMLHTHMNSIIFYLPFLPLAYTVIAIELIRRFRLYILNISQSALRKKPIYKIN